MLKRPKKVKKRKKKMPARNKVNKNRSQDDPVPSHSSNHHLRRKKKWKVVLNLEKAWKKNKKWNR